MAAEIDREGNLWIAPGRGFNEAAANGRGNGAAGKSCSRTAGRLQ